MDAGWLEPNGKHLLRPVTTTTTFSNVPVETEGGHVASQAAYSKCIFCREKIRWMGPIRWKELETTKSTDIFFFSASAVAVQDIAGLWQFHGVCGSSCGM